MGRLLGKRSDVMGAAMTPHKYAAVIKAWADGAAVQYRTNDRAVWQDWVSTSYSAIPSFRADVEWRLMPAPVKLMYRIALMRKPSGGDFFLDFAHSIEDAAKVCADDNFVDWAGEWEMVEA